MTHRLSITTPPAAEPVTLQEAKLFLKIDHDAEDALITSIIAAARESAEKYLQLALITRKASLFMDAWPEHDATPWWDGVREGVAAKSIQEITLPLPPMQNIDAIRIHNHNDFIVMDENQYFCDTADVPGRIVFKNDTTLPEPARIANGVEIAFTAGYGDNPDNVPASIRQGILKLIAHLYTYRGDNPDTAITESGAHVLFYPYRRMRLT